MAISPGFITKVRRDMRLEDDEEINEMLREHIEACREDLESLGVAWTEDRAQILAAAKLYVRWKFGLDNEKSMQMLEEYQTIVDNVRKRALFKCSQAE
jgi:hypothetical protein